jgi:hypothetical protein
LRFVFVAEAFSRPPDEVRDKWSAQAFFDAELVISARNKAERKRIQRLRAEQKS